MFSKNIILFLCVAVLIKSSTKVQGVKPWNEISDGFFATEDINPNLDDLADKNWQDIFEKCETDNDGLITTKELQDILFKEFKVFLTIRQAETYIYLINLEENHEIGLEQFKKMKPIIYILSQRRIPVDDDDKNVHKIEPKSIEFVVEVMAGQFKELFSNKTEALEALKFFGVNDKLPIERKELDEILLMLYATQLMESIYQNFLEEVIKDDVIMDQSFNDDGVLDFHKYLSCRFAHSKFTKLCNKVKRKLKNVVKNITFLDKNQ